MVVIDVKRDRDGQAEEPRFTWHGRLHHSASAGCDVLDYVVQVLPEERVRNKTFTVEYATQGKDGPVTNRYGRFATEDDARRWLRDNPVQDGRVIPSHPRDSSHIVEWPGRK